MLSDSPVEESRWRAVQQRDTAQDGTFLYGVLTTGIYCKPSCGSRKPLRHNVRFYNSVEDAERDALRACKRCKPTLTVSPDPDAASIRSACLYLRSNAQAPSRSRELARRVGMSVSHFQRTFKRLVGVTPRRYAAGIRIEAFKQKLKNGGNVTDTIYASGFGSGSRVYEQSNQQLGMTPAQFGRGGAGVNIVFASVPSRMGRMMLGATDRGLCFVQFGDTHGGLLAVLGTEYPAATLVPAEKPYHPDLERWIDALNQYLNGTQTSLDLPLDVRATAFQMRVWDYLRTIPYGEVRSYSDVAGALGAPRAVRAVASACARNAVALLVPCHRVLRSSGALGGYRWGLDRKQSLLDMEAPQVADRCVGVAEGARVDR